MVKFYENYFSYDFAWPAVTLAYFLRYPNPYSSHVLASDTLSRHLDPTTGKLTTVRLLLKRGKLPAAVARFLPKIKESYILESSEVDIRNQTMVTETRNLDWEGVISVVENQVYTPSYSSHNNSSDGEKTDVKLTVKISSRVGSNAREKVADAASSGGLWASWTTGSIQKSIEVIGMKRMREGLGRSKEGMKVVLEGLREKGLLAAMQERRERRLADKEEGVQSKWSSIWRGATGMNEGDKLRKDSDE
ncbi:MSF1-domain-containing protein [Terfezia boudieri ATCC MYA-4762]|uniref:MSF1-domain-containing protein n=1 Tax=Terfezia boudieri ATCC MYA-4762 TaxID=1051890 RepID=A0A3N4LEG2_9PEZI|nr:MSF1-domain-containing protein [Terfezia boudieri ATCC MYA-4762]